ncbi:MAG: aldo/keto reductase [Gemmatimonadetes bacterium]|nr:aldo/keto reductase [Gemmatimonadota bacterium]
MLTRREWLRISAGAGAALSLNCTGEAAEMAEAAASAGGATSASGAGELARSASSEILKAIPSTGEQIPVIGLGGRWISTNSTPEELRDHRAVLHALADDAPPAGRLFDSAAGYGGGASEDLSGDWAAEDGFQDQIFWATKVNVAGRGGGSVDPAAVREQIERSFERMSLDVIDLNQVHNMGDPPTQLGVLQEYKDAGRIRYIGITTTSESQYGELAQVMRDYPLDFIGIDYAVDNRVAEEEILPLAQEEGIAVIVYLPFGRSRMWQRIGDRELPEWASEFDASTWAQFMLKYVVAHPAVTVAAPGTGDPEHMVDNLGAAQGAMPTPEHLEQMVALVESQPTA